MQFQSVAAFQCTQKDDEEEAVMRDYQWAVFCLLTPQTPHHHHPLLLSLPPSSGLSPTILSINHRHSFTVVGTRFYS